MRKSIRMLDGWASERFRSATAHSGGKRIVDTTQREPHPFAHMNTQGLVEQSFCGALQHELTDYYRLVAVMESQINQSTGDNGTVAKTGQ